ncbi:MAG: hypothetical protein CVV45_12185 [Spirochaetae bacterium HGW-Spirochaetae-10]|nr:MAG: hypothetical protein CVV45_12185 [Spirochaetae bacterium HGW-Spirochaetae-10]
MLSFLTPALLLMHGLIHLIGFRRQDLSRPVRSAWLVCAALFVGSAMLVFLTESWWMVSAVALLLSQSLIAFHWKDAKAGTIVNVAVLVVILLGYGEHRFNRLAADELSILESNPIRSGTSPEITQADLNHLPASVGRWLTRSGVVGQRHITGLSLTQTGEMRTTPDGSWMPFTARQQFRVDTPGFLWMVNVKAAPGIALRGRDLLHSGRGSMRIELLSLIPVADAKGPQIDQGAIVRFLAESIWFPTSALEPYMSWTAVSDSQARVTLKQNAQTVHADFFFDANGDIIAIEADRYMDRNGSSTLERWRIDIDPASKEAFLGLNGIPFHLPTKSTVTWKLKEGDFTWLKLKIADLKYQ